MIPSLILWFTLLSAPPAARPIQQAPDPSAEEEKIVLVIRRQLDAFKRDDYSGAYTFFSKAFRKEFPPDLFEARIRARFKEVARPAQVLFRRFHFHRGDTRAVLEVDIAGANARLATVEYRMVFEEGSWKIDGLEPLDPFRAL